MGTLENNVIKALEPIVKNLDNPRIKALAKYLGLTKEDEQDIYYESYDIYCFGNEEYLVLTDDEADEKVAEYIKDSVWAFNPSFLSSHSGIDQEIFKLLQDKCESANEAILKLIKDFDEFVQDAIGKDGRGHFLSSYDGYENDHEHDNETYYIYQIN
jgi:SET domain-containing protein